MDAIITNFQLLLMTALVIVSGEWLGEALGLAKKEVAAFSITQE